MDSNPLALIKTFLPEQAAVAAEKGGAFIACQAAAVESAGAARIVPWPEAGRGEPIAPLFKRGWLRKGGGAFIVAPSGVGKSVFTVQAAICWSLGKAAFGVEPVRPLKIAVIQAEDDREEVGYFRNCVTRAGWWMSSVSARRTSGSRWGGMIRRRRGCSSTRRSASAHGQAAFVEDLARCSTSGRTSTS